MDGASPEVSNPDPTNPSGRVPRFHQPEYCFDNPAESWDEVHLDYDDGKFDGFTTENAANDPTRDPTGSRSMGFYDASDLPFYYALARAFAISDRHFCAVLGPTFPNRLFFMAGTSFGVVNDVFPPSTDAQGNPYPNLFTRLNDAHVSWNIYSQDRPTPALLTATRANNLSHFLPQERFFTDAQNGALPGLSFVEGSDTQGGVSLDEDPPADPQPGEAMVAGIVQAVMTAPQWTKTALLITYDEGGGLYDHVDPPKACVPDDIAPDISDRDVQARFDQDGYAGAAHRSVALREAWLRVACPDRSREPPPAGRGSLQLAGADAPGCQRGPSVRSFRFCPPSP